MPDASFDDLFDLPLSAFTAERDKLAAALRKGGRKDEAALVKGLPRPTVSAWATNQAVRRAPHHVERLFEAVDRLREVQVGAAPESDARRGYREALEAQRVAVTELVDVARRALEHAGHGSSAGVIARIEANLRRGAADAEARDRLLMGRLTKDVSMSDFGALVGQIPLQPTAARAVAAESRTAKVLPFRDHRGNDRRRGEEDADVPAEPTSVTSAPVEQDDPASEALARLERALAEARSFERAAQASLGRASADAARASASAERTERELRKAETARAEAERALAAARAAFDAAVVAHGEAARAHATADEKRADAARAHEEAARAVETARANAARLASELLERERSTSAPQQPHAKGKPSPRGKPPHPRR